MTARYYRIWDRAVSAWRTRDGGRATLQQDAGVFSEVEVAQYSDDDDVQLYEVKRSEPVGQPDPQMRQFATGATRDSDSDKPDYEGFISPVVLQRFGQYMHKHRRQADGSLRDSDNWQKGIPLVAYRKSLIRHTVDCWATWRQGDVEQEIELLCAIMFNVQGLLFELLREHNAERMLQAPHVHFGVTAEQAEKLRAGSLRANGQ